MLNFEQFEVLSFDCYGTLIDWESGLLPILQSLLEKYHIKEDDRVLLESFAKFEADAEKETFINYRQVLRKVVTQFGVKYDLRFSETELNSLGESLKNWQPFPDTVDTLKQLKEKYKLAIISNVDDDLFAETAKHLAIEFDYVITAQQVKAYKPSTRNFEIARDRMGIAPEKWLHIAQSIYHDIVPAKSLGLSTIWVNRRKDKEGSGATLPAIAKPDLEIPDLQSLISKIK
jgi:2-haloacid dehalogenase